MKNANALILLVLLTFSCKVKTQTVSEFHPIVHKAYESSLYSQDVDWEIVNEQFKDLTRNTDNINEALQYLLNSLKDKHASFRSTTNQSIIVSYNGEVDEIDKRNPKFVNEVINDITAKFEYRLLDENIGYLKVVGIGPGKIEENANLIRNGLINLKSKNVNKWILDLRYNGGGDMNPMLSGLAPLIGEGFIGGSVGRNDELLYNYEIRDGQFYDNDRLVVEMENNPIISDNEKVAVLLSKYTISSGELTAIAFKGRPNTYFIGEKTAGYTTGNGWEEVTENLIMCISEAVFIDRNKVKYLNKVGVDLMIEFEESKSLEDDKQILSAKKWLTK